MLYFYVIDLDGPVGIPVIGAGPISRDRQPIAVDHVPEVRRTRQAASLIFLQQDHTIYSEPAADVLEKLLVGRPAGIYGQALIVVVTGTF